MLQLVLECNQYKAFVKYAVENCDAFSLVFEKDDSDKTKYVFHDFYMTLSEFVLDKASIGIHPETGTFFENSDIVYFKCNKQSGSILFMADNIFDWNGDSIPEELCFYQKNSSWFISICHEKIAVVLDATEDDKMFFKSKGIQHWDEI